MTKKKALIAVEIPESREGWESGKGGHADEREWWSVGRGKVAREEKSPCDDKNTLKLLHRFISDNYEYDKKCTASTE